MAKPLLTVNDILKVNAGSVASALSFLRQLETDYGREGGGGKMWSTRVYGGIDPGVWGWYESVGGSDPDAKIRAKSESESKEQRYVNPDKAIKQAQAEAEYQARLSGNAVLDRQSGQTVYTEQGARSLGVQPGTVLQQPLVTSNNGIPQSELNKAMAALNSQGLTINPNKNLTELDVAEFLKRAEREVEPYYASQFKLGREAFLQASGYNRSSILENEAKLERQYGKDLKTLTENSAETGFAQSGKRVLEEQDLATNYNSQIGEGRRKLGYDELTRAMTFAEKFGSSNMPINQSITEAPGAVPGQVSFNRGNAQRSLYNIDSSVLDNIIGTQQKEKATGARELAQFYENQARTARSLPI